MIEQLAAVPQDVRNSIAMSVLIAAVIFWLKDDVYVRYGASGAFLFAASIMPLDYVGLSERLHELIVVWIGIALALWLVCALVAERHRRRPLPVREALFLPIDLAVYAPPSDVRKIDAHFSVVALTVYSFAWAIAASHLYYLVDLAGGIPAYAIGFVKVTHIGPPIVAMALAVVISVKLLLNTDHLAENFSWINLKGVTQ